MDALKIKTLEEDNLFLRGQVQLLQARNAQLEERIAQLTVSIPTPFSLLWTGIVRAIFAVISGDAIWTEWYGGSDIRRVRNLNLGAVNVVGKRRTVNSLRVPRNPTGRCRWPHYNCRRYNYNLLRLMSFAVTQTSGHTCSNWGQWASGTQVTLCAAIRVRMTAWNLTDSWCSYEKRALR
jgi:hypothetical protein